jgi:choline dehydrogenase-like flavoprotein
MIERGDFDYVIVGGGSAGCVLAARLSENPFVRVCLLEAGPADKSVLLHCPAGLALLAKNGAYNWAFETVPQPGLGGRRGYQPRGKVLGGSSSVNAMIYVRGQPEDYDGWASRRQPRLGLARRAAVLSGAPSTTSAAATPFTARAARSTSWTCAARIASGRSSSKRRSRPGTLQRRLSTARARKASAFTR